jgi:hypothetical protein
VDVCCRDNNGDCPNTEDEKPLFHSRLVISHALAGVPSVDRCYMHGGTITVGPVYDRPGRSKSAGISCTIMDPATV